MKKKNNWYVNQRKFHYIYKTICLINGKFYYGMHSTDDLEDGYIGSGTHLWHSIKKHGRENFKLEILEFCSDRESLRTREREVVNEKLLADPMCMNLTLGGSYVFKDVREKISLSLKDYFSDAGNRTKRSNQQKLYRQSRTLKQKEEYSNLMKLIWGKGTTLNSEQSQRIKDSWDREEVRLNRTKGIQRVYDTTDLREIRSKKQIELWKTTEYRETFKTARIGLKYKAVELKQQELCRLILTSSIDVSKVGWYKEMAIELDVSYSSIKTIIKTRLPELWDKCYFDKSHVSWRDK